MSEHFKLKAAVMAIVFREGLDSKEILLQKRQNTGFRDGYWDFASSGHLEEGESLTQAMTRELKEEIGIDVKEDKLGFCHLTHLTETEIDINYINCYFIVNEYQGEPQIMEPHKCSDLEWFNLDSLPDTMIPSRRRVLEQVLNKSYYSEDGFK